MNSLDINSNGGLDPLVHSRKGTMQITATPSVDVHGRKERRHTCSTRRTGKPVPSASITTD